MHTQRGAIEIVPDRQSDGRVELLTGEPMFVHNNMKMNWSAAEDFCVSIGGHLASVPSTSHWQRLKDFIADSDVEGESVWLGVAG